MKYYPLVVVRGVQSSSCWQPIIINCSVPYFVWSVIFLNWKLIRTYQKNCTIYHVSIYQYFTKRSVFAYTASTNKMHIYINYNPFVDIWQKSSQGKSIGDIRWLMWWWIMIRSARCTVSFLEWKTYVCFSLIYLVKIRPVTGLREGTDGFPS